MLMRGLFTRIFPPSNTFKMQITLISCPQSTRFLDHVRLRTNALFQRGKSTSWIIDQLGSFPQMLFSYIAASHSSITGWHPAHTFPLLPGIRPVTPICISRRCACSSGEAKLWTVAVSHCLCAWQCSSQPPLCSHQEMSFSNSFSNALNSSLLSSDEAKSKRDPLLVFASTPLAWAAFLHFFHALIFIWQELHTLQWRHSHLSHVA